MCVACTVFVPCSHAYVRVTVVVEEPTYFLGRVLLEDHGVRIHTLPVTHDGLDIE